MNLQESWFAVVNPQSANGKTKDAWPYLYEKIKQADIPVDYAYTSSQGNGIEMTRRAINRGYHKIIAVGGDGTVNEVVNGLMVDDREAVEGLELAIFAQGTGSDFIRTLPFQNSIASFLAVLKRNTTQRIDIGKVSFRNSQAIKESRYFINVSNLGIGAEIVHHVNNKTKALGSKLAYLTGTISTIMNFKKSMYTLTMQTGETADQVIQGKYCGIMICNGQFIGGGMHIAPNAQINDGFFDLILIKDTSKTRLMTRFPLIYKGKHLNLPEIEVLRCRALSIETTASSLLEADGEIIGVTPAKYQIIPQCLTLRV